MYTARNFFYARGAATFVIFLVAISAMGGTVWCKKCDTGCNNGSGPGGSGFESGGTGTGNGSWIESERYWYPHKDCNGVGASCNELSSRSDCYKERTRSCTTTGGCAAWSSWLWTRTNDCS